MSEKFVEVNEATSATRPKIKTFESTDPDDNVVESQAVVTVDAATGDPVELATEATLADVETALTSMQTSLVDIYNRLGGVLTASNADAVEDGNTYFSTAFATLIAGHDGAQFHHIKTDSQGRLVVVEDGGFTVDDGGGSLTVDGSVVVTDGSGSLTVDDGGGSITVDGPLTDAQLRAAAVPISDGGASITVDGPLTNAELRAAAVPISAAALPLPTGAATEATLAALSAVRSSTAVLGAVDDAVELAVIPGYAIGFRVRDDDFDFIGTIVVEVSYDDGGQWIEIERALHSYGAAAPGVYETIDNGFNVNSFGTIVVPAGVTNVRLRVLGWTAGSLSATLSTSLETSDAIFGGPCGKFRPYGAVQLGLRMSNGNFEGLETGQQAMADSIPVALASDQTSLSVVGAAADGSTPSGNPVLMAGQDGTNVQSLKTDTTGRQEVIGGAAAGAALAGNPVPIAASDGANAQIPRAYDLDTGAGSQYALGVNLRRSANGGSAELLGQGTMAQSLPVTMASDQTAIKMQGNAADGAAVAGNPVLIAGGDGSGNAQTLLTDTSGRLQMVGAAADGAAVAGNPVLIAGQDGTNAQSLKTDSTGRIEVTHTTTATLGNGAETAVSNVAVQVLASNANRKSAIIQNTGTANIRVGVAGVTATTGHRLAPGDYARLGFPFLHTGAVYAIREGAADSIAFAQEET